MTIKESLRAAKERTAALDDADNRIFQAITAVEEALRAHINIRIRIAIDDKQFLAFGKFSGAWRLLIEGPHGQQTLAGSSRETRAMVFAERLVEQLVLDAGAQMDKQIEERERALVVASTILDALTKGVAS